MENLLTIGQIQNKVGLPIWRINYIIQTRRIQPKGRIGRVRVFSPAVIQMILQILDMAVSPLNPSRTIRIFSSAENFRRVAFLICFTTSFDSAIFSTPFRGQRTLIMELKSAISSVFLHAGKHL